GDEGTADELERGGGGEEGHGAREMEAPVDEHALLDHLVVEAGLLGRDRHREACRPGAHHDEVSTVVAGHKIEPTRAPLPMGCPELARHKILGFSLTASCSK